MDHRESKKVPKKIYLFLIDYAKAFDCVDHNKLWEILKEMGIPDHLTCLLRNLSLESVFVLLAGFVLLHQVLTVREVIGCVLMFAAIMLAQK